MMGSVIVFLVGFPLIGVLLWIIDPYRRFRKQLDQRSPMLDAELIAMYFSEGKTPAEVVARVRRVFSEQTGLPAEKILPDDDFSFYWDEIDAAPFFESLDTEFDRHFTDDEINLVTSPTVRSVSEWVHRCCQSDIVR